jgi:hypothetical protein
MRRRFHHRSQFGDGLRSPRDREWMAQWRARIGFLRRGGKLTALHAEIALALSRRLGLDGRCDPSHATLAADASAGCRTVQRALARLSALGMLGWVRRLTRDGSFCEQTSNSYALRLGDGQVGHETRKQIFTSVSAAATRVLTGVVKGALTAFAVPDRAALAAIRIIREKALAARWMGARV